MRISVIANSATENGTDQSLGGVQTADRLSGLTTTATALIFLTLEALQPNRVFAKKL